MRIRLEFRPRDFFVGAYGERRTSDGRIHLWICLVPMLPIHLVFGRDRRLLRQAPLRREVTAYGIRRTIH